LQLEKAQAHKTEAYRLNCYCYSWNSKEESGNEANTACVRF